MRVWKSTWTRNMEPKYSRKYSGSERSAGVTSTRLAELLKQEGQPCSYCIAVYMLLADGDELPPGDATAYGNHLVWAHGKKPYHVEP